MIKQIARVTCLFLLAFTGMASQVHAKIPDQFRSEIASVVLGLNDLEKIAVGDVKRLRESWCISIILTNTW